MGILRDKMLIAMQTRGFAEGTFKHYFRAMEDLTRYYKRSPDTLTRDEILAYISYLLNEKKISPRSCNTIMGGIKFFYAVVLNDSERAPLTKIPHCRQRIKLPVILSVQELELIFEQALNLKNLLFLWWPMAQDFDQVK